jgi:acetyltransferase-like isoleucine patch superfamily enzyme
VAVTAPLWLLCRLETVATHGEGVFTAMSELVSLFPGRLGVYLRRGFYRMCLTSFALDCHVGFGTTLAHREVRIGRGVYIGNRCTLGKVIVEDDVAIGSNVDVLSGRYQHSFDRSDRPILEQGRAFYSVVIGRNSWIGNSSVIMADIGDNCIIGAGSVVVRPIPPLAVAAGNPATVKRQRRPTGHAAASDYLATSAGQGA